MYKNLNKQREFMRDQYRLKYWIDDEFRELEAQRKADWYSRNRDRINETRRHRAAASRKQSKNN